MSEERGGFRKTGWTFAQVPIWVICDPRLGSGELRLFGYLVWRQGTDAGCWPGKRRMAADLDVTPETVRRWLRGLERCGYVRVHKRAGKSNVYEALADPDGASEKYTPKGRREASPTNLTGDPPQNCVGYPPQNCVYTPHKIVPHDDSHERESCNESMAAEPRTFPEWLTKVRGEKNQVAVLRGMVETLYPEHDVPDYGRIGAAMKRLGGAGNLARLLWLYSARPPTGRVLDYIERAEGAKRARGEGDHAAHVGAGEAAGDSDGGEAESWVADALRDRTV